MAERTSSTVSGRYPHRLGVGAERRDAHTGGAGAHVAVHNLAGLMIHLHLLLGIVVVGHHVNLWNDVVGQLMGKLVDGLYLALGENLTVLLPAPLALW